MATIIEIIKKVIIDRRRIMSIIKQKNVVRAGQRDVGHRYDALDHNTGSYFRIR